ncbi:hypothetical protein IAE49_03985 [Kosakonia sp. S58]|uniref:hypothetical protein n=1 Tax=unclassified Kosakonia TaxID=2632876 RepID=UPI001904F836|nr:MULTISPECIES: hypothetical protein [unclassified Kosakonia]MBK0078686.1 hypothetical protein [Kosakonia sp. S57]MBK0085395.1 hypothetical protein [Kosakonia sp. S58]
MTFFIVWEAYTSDWQLMQKGSRFMSTDDPDIIDVDLAEYVADMAKALGIEEKYLVITSVQSLGFLN